jgi:hypothetical protein
MSDRLTPDNVLIEDADNATYEDLAGLSGDEDE